MPKTSWLNLFPVLFVLAAVGCEATKSEADTTIASDTIASTNDLGPPAPTSAGCTAQSDRDAFAAGGFVPFEAASGCVFTCVNKPDGCVASCVDGATELTGDCTACFAALVTCQSAHCSSPCSNVPSGAGCVNCMESSDCSKAFDTCSQIAHGIAVPSSY